MIAAAMIDTIRTRQPSFLVGRVYTVAEERQIEVLGLPDSSRKDRGQMAVS